MNFNLTGQAGLTIRIKDMQLIKKNSNIDSVFVIEEAGVYEVNANTHMAHGDNKMTLVLALVLNGFPTDFATVNTKLSDQYMNMTLNCLVELDEGDRLSLSLTNETAPLNGVPATSRWTIFNCKRVRTSGS
jgi:hypothetical protein